MPATTRVSSASSTASFTGVSVKVAVAAVTPAAIVRSNGATAVKSPAAAVPADTVTPTTVMLERAPASRVPVIASAAPPAVPSGTRGGSTARRTSDERLKGVPVASADAVATAPAPLVLKALTCTW